MSNTKQRFGQLASAIHLLVQKIEVQSVKTGAPAGDIVKLPRKVKFRGAITFLLGELF